MAVAIKLNVSWTVTPCSLVVIRSSNLSGRDETNRICGFRFVLLLKTHPV
jgi:hypothetical protein